jgi:MtN3 and saliva related transmembrane protein
MTPTLIGILAGICTAISMIPQLIKIIRDKKAEDISVFSFVVLISGVALWILYGLIKHDLPIIYTNVFSFLVNVTVLILSLKIKRKMSEQ